MCLAILKPADVALSETDLLLAYEENPDGCGLAYRGKDRVKVYRGLWSFDRFMDTYSKFADRELLVHFRWASMGVLSKGNTHPIPFGKHALIHNGHMGKWGNKQESDTVQWTRNVLQPIMKACPHILQSESMVHLLERDIGQSKIVVMPHESETVILNERLGIWDPCGAWFSQVHFREAMDWEEEDTPGQLYPMSRYPIEEEERAYRNTPPMGDDMDDQEYYASWQWRDHRYGR